MRTEIIKSREAYDNLLAGILRQTIQDYVLTKRRQLQGRVVSESYDANRRLKSCELFFEDNQYDYGDIDLKGVKRLCDEIVREGGKVYLREGRGASAIWN